MILLKSVFLYVKEVMPETVKVDMTHFPHTVEVPRELFSDAVLTQLKPGSRITARVNRTRMESRLVIAGPFEVSEGPGQEQDAIVSEAVFHEPGAHKEKRLFIVDLWKCTSCRANFCAACSPQSSHTCKTA